TGTSRHRGANSTLFETELGLRVDARFEDIPELGKVPIPTGKVYVGEARLRSDTPKFGSDSRLELGIDRVDIVSGLFGTNGDWSVSSRVTYKTFDNKWRNGVEARVYNIMGGYSTDLEGKDEFQLGLVGRKSYMSVTTGSEGSTLNVGRVI